MSSVRKLEPVVNDAAIAALEVALAWARNGQIKGLAIISFHPDGQVSTGVHGHWSHSEIIFAVERMKFHMMRDYESIHGEFG